MGVLQSATTHLGGVEFLKRQPKATRPVGPEPAGYLAETLALLNNTQTSKPCTAQPQSESARVPSSNRPEQSCIDYDSIPAGSLASDFASLGYECCQVNEFGTAVNLRRPGKLTEVSFVLDSWGCEHRAAPTVVGQAGVCTTKPGATFRVPITLHVYAVCAAGSCAAPNVNSEVGNLVASQTTTFEIPYRPSDSPKQCPVQTLTYTNAFLDPISRLCVHGLANKITFDFPGSASLPNPAIFTLAYNTTTWGYHPIGPAACSTTLAGCGYDSLNVVADSTGGQSVGTYLDPNTAFVNYVTGANYCDGGASGFDFLRADNNATDSCWNGFQPQLEVTINT